VFFKVAQGFENLMNGEINYTRFDAKINKKFKKGKLGETNFTLIGGMVQGDVPYTLLYNGRATFNSGLGIATAGVFETMRVNEFVSDQHVGVFFKHNFGTFLKKGKFAPEFLIAHNSAWGSLNNKERHQEIIFNTFDKGFHETGLVFNKLLSGSFSAVGIGVYHRYGYYSLPVLKDNFAFKLTSTISF
jgi:hypothetical protein